MSLLRNYASFPIFDMLFLLLGFSIKVLLGETPECELDNCLPSKSGLRTVLEVLKIQMNFWPTLASTLTKLESEWGSCLVENRSECPFVSTIFFPSCVCLLLLLSVSIVKKKIFIRQKSYEDGVFPTRMKEKGKETSK